MFPAKLQVIFWTLTVYTQKMELAPHLEQELTQQPLIKSTEITLPPWATDCASLFASAVFPYFQTLQMPAEEQTWSCSKPPSEPAFLILLPAAIPPGEEPGSCHKPQAQGNSSFSRSCCRAGPERARRGSSCRAWEPPALGMSWHVPRQGAKTHFKGVGLAVGRQVPISRMKIPSHPTWVTAAAWVRWWKLPEQGEGMISNISKAFFSIVWALNKASVGTQS